MIPRGLARKGICRKTAMEWKTRNPRAHGRDIAVWEHMLS